MNEKRICAGNMGDITFMCRPAMLPMIKPQEAQARFARARLCLPYNEGRKETLRPK